MRDEIGLGAKNEATSTYASILDPARTTAPYHCTAGTLLFESP
ncbi:unnamed protein product [Larinioides sclopetarius]|uniref:Ribulose-1,5-bisphosphate carboxylase/oxygenase large subunit n=1 Tax=Larinioides sclopetarius TaxID=280406 RepID=A0AAV1YVI0_9ARAC